MKTRSFAISMVVASLCVSSSAASAQDHSDAGIGVFTAVQGAVTVTHPRAARTQPVNLHDEVLFKDVIETRKESRTKAFFEDDSILTVGEQSRVEITEHIYNPERNMRRVVVKLVRGRLRVLVGKVFTGAGSKFEIHTSTALAAVRGTYFVIWVENGMSGIANIGNSGRVDFTSGGKSVIVAPGQYSVAEDGGPPAPPLAYDLGSKLSIGPATSVNKAAVMSTAESAVAETTQTIEAATGKVEQTVGNTVGTVNTLAQRGRDALASVKHAISDTVLQDTPKRESAKDAVRAMQPVGPALPPASGIVNATSGTVKTTTGQTTPSTQSVPVGSVGPLAPATSPVTSVVSGAPAVPVTPPAVVSGAAGTLGLPRK